MAGVFTNYTPRELENMGYMRLGERKEGCNFIVMWKHPTGALSRRARNYASFPAALRMARQRAERYGRSQVRYRCGSFTSRETTYSAKRLRGADLVVTCRKVEGRVVCVTATPKGLPPRKEK